jgi:hypothetical protein
MLSSIKENALSLATIGIMVIASVVYLSIGVSVILGSGWDSGPRIAYAAEATPTPSPTPCTPDDPRKPCPTPEPTVSPIPSPTLSP